MRSRIGFLVSCALWSPLILAGIGIDVWDWVFQIEERDTNEWGPS